MTATYGAFEAIVDIGHVFQTIAERNNKYLRSRATDGFSPISGLTNAAKQYEAHNQSSCFMKPLRDIDSGANSRQNNASNAGKQVTQLKQDLPNLFSKWILLAEEFASELLHETGDAILSLKRTKSIFM